MHNTQVRIQNKSGTVLATTSLASWWSALGSVGPFDPHVVYDPYNNRWIACAGAGNNGTRSAILIAVSLTSDPTGSWYLYGFYVDPNAVLFGDYPTLGYNKDKVAVQMNLFNGNTATGTTIFIFDKATMYAGGTLTAGSTMNQLNLSSSSYGFVEYPAQTYDTNLTTLYFLGTANDNNGAGKGLLAIYTLTGTVASPTFALSANFPSAAPLGVLDYSRRRTTKRFSHQNQHRRFPHGAGDLPQRVSLVGPNHCVADQQPHAHLHPMVANKSH